MRSGRTLLAVGIVAAMAAPTLLAQATSSRPTKASSSRTSVSSARAASAPTSRTRVGSARSGAATRRTSSALTGNSNRNFDRPRIVRNPYYDNCRFVFNRFWLANPYHQGWYSRGERHRYYSFMGALGLRHNTFFRDSMERFGYFDVPLTDPMMDAVLKDSHVAAQTILDETQTVNSLIAAYEGGRIDRRRFDREAENALKRIRKAAKTIRKDDYLAFVDLRLGYSDVKKLHGETRYEKAKSMDELKSMVSELRTMTLSLQEQLVFLNKYAPERTVDVNALRQPSVQAISHKISRLAKAIGKTSFKKL